jgi:hippurate hydrolase
MDSIMQEALELQQTILQHRRYLHRHAELNMDLPVTKAYVLKQLRDMGYEPQEICQSGVVVLVGKNKTGKTILLRADMDALPIKEISDLEFKSETEAMHACGHDTHTAMLLGAAKILQDHEDEIQGQVKLMFQPGEETLSGAKAMIEAGVLENPKVDAAMMIHSAAGFPIPAGTFLVGGESLRPSSGDCFRIDIEGKGCHGAMPNLGVDPLNVAAHIHLGLQAINAREAQPGEIVIVTVGAMHGGNAPNVIPETAFMEGTIRTRAEGPRKFAMERLVSIAETIGMAFRAKVHAHFLYGTPSMATDSQLARDCLKYATETLKDVAPALNGDDVGGPKLNAGSEDFSFVSQKVPTVLCMLSLGSPEEGYPYSMHHPKAKFDDSKLFVGAAAYAGIAMKWLDEHR